MEWCVEAQPCDDRGLLSTRVLTAITIIVLHVVSCHILLCCVVLCLLASALSCLFFRPTANRAAWQISTAGHDR